MRSKTSRHTFCGLTTYSDRRVFKRGIYGVFKTFGVVFAANLLIWYIVNNIGSYERTSLSCCAPMYQISKYYNIAKEHCNYSYTSCDYRDHLEPEFSEVEKWKMEITSIENVKFQEMNKASARVANVNMTPVYQWCVSRTVCRTAQPIPKLDWADFSVSNCKHAINFLDQLFTCRTFGPNVANVMSRLCYKTS